MANWNVNLEHEGRTSSPFPKGDPFRERTHPMAERNVLAVKLELSCSKERIGTLAGRGIRERRSPQLTSGYGLRS